MKKFPFLFILVIIVSCKPKLVRVEVHEAHGSTWWTEEPAHIQKMEELLDRIRNASSCRYVTYKRWGYIWYEEEKHVPSIEIIISIDKDHYILREPGSDNCLAISMREFDSLYRKMEGLVDVNKFTN